MLRTVVSGILALALAVTFFGVVLLKIQEPVLWIVIAIGVVLMIWNIVDGVRNVGTSGPQQPDTLPTGQQERKGVS